MLCLDASNKGLRLTMLCNNWVARVVWNRKEMSAQKLLFLGTGMVIQIGEQVLQTLSEKAGRQFDTHVLLPAAQPTGIAAANAPIRGAAPSWMVWRMSVWFCIQTQSLQDEPRSWSDLLAQPAIFVFFWLCFISFFTLCSIMAGSLSSCPLVFSLSAKCQLSLPTG